MEKSNQELQEPHNLHTFVKVNEIFNSISGEVSPYLQGKLTTFLRLAECPVQCGYCDTEYSTKVTMSVKALVEELQLYLPQTQALCITGGEPLFQKKATEEIINALRLAYPIWIETSGCLPFLGLSVPVVVDYKLKSAQTKIANRPIQEFLELRNHDWVKFVITDKSDFEQALTVLKHFQYRQINIAFSLAENSKFDLLQAMLNISF